MASGASLTVWTITVLALAAFLWFYAIIIRRRPHEPSHRESLLWLSVVVGLTVEFALALLWTGGTAAVADFTSEYLQQYVFSVDAVFLTAVTLARYHVPRPYQQLAILAATAVALLVRSVMVLAGWVLTERWVWLAFVSAALYAFRALVALGGGNEDIDDFRERPHVRWMRRLIPMSNTFDGARFLARRERGQLVATPLVLVAVAVATSDMLFAPEPGNAYHQFAATALALLLVVPLQFLLGNTLPGELLRLGRLLAVVLLLMCVRMMLTGAAAVHLTHVGSYRLPTRFADSVWISLLLAVIVTAAVARATTHFWREGLLLQPVRVVRSSVRRRRRFARAPRIVSTSVVPAVRFRLADGRYLSTRGGEDGELVACRLVRPGPAETFAVVNRVAWPPGTGDALVLEGFTGSWNLSCRRMRVAHAAGRRSSRYVIGGPGTQVFVRLPFPATWPAYGGEDPAERTFTLVRPYYDGESGFALRVTTGRRRRLVLRVVEGGPTAAVHADGRFAGAAGTLFDAEFGAVGYGTGWTGESA